MNYLEVRVLSTHFFFQPPGSFRVFERPQRFEATIKTLPAMKSVSLEYGFIVTDLIIFKFSISCVIMFSSGSIDALIEDVAHLDNRGDRKAHCLIIFVPLCQPRLLSPFGLKRDRRHPEQWIAIGFDFAPIGP